MRISDLSIDRPVATLMLLLSLMVLGAVAVFQLPLDYMPLVQEPEVDVVVPFPGAHPLEALREVLIPIEEEIATIPGVKRIHANSGSVWWSSSSTVELEVNFDWDADLDVKKMEVREAVERARPRLPEGIGFIRVEGDVSGPAAGAVLQGRISAERNLAESWELIDRRIRRPLERVKGVAHVDLYGVEPQEVRIDIDLDALRRHDVDAGSVIQRIQAFNMDVDVGRIRGSRLSYDVRWLGRFPSVEAIRGLRLGDGELKLSDVARVDLTEPVLPYGRHLNRQFAIGFDIHKEPTANTVETVDMLMARITEIRQDPNLEGVNLLIWNNAGEEIRRSLTGLRNAGLFGGLLAIGVLFFFLRRTSTTLIVAVAIPFSLLVTCGAMYLLKMQFNVLTLLGLMLGVGMLVDNAVVVIENIYRLQGLGVPTAEAARRGAREVTMAVVASTATTVCVWSWLFVSERNEMVIYMGAVAITICLAVCCSLLISLTFIPLAAVRFVPARPVEPGFLLSRLVPRYRRLLGWTLRHRAAALTALLLLAVSAAFPISQIEKTGEPKMQERAVSIGYEIKDTMTKEVMEGYVNRVEAAIEEHKAEFGYDNIYSWYTERARGTTSVYLPRGQSNEKGLARLREQIRGVLPTIAGVKLRMGEREWHRRGRGDKRIVGVALHGEDPEFLEKLALDVESRFKEIEDTIEVWGPSLATQKEVRVRIDTERARSLGLSPDLVARAVSFVFRGRNLDRFHRGDSEHEIIVGLPEDERPGLAALRDLPIPRPDGEPIPLGSVAELELMRTNDRINRENRQTTTWVSAEFDPDKVTTEEAKKRLEARLAGVRFPEGYTWDYGDWGRRHDEGLGTMIRGVSLALVAVVLLMAALFESFSQPIAILITLPLAFFGAFWALWIFGFDLDVVGFMGVIILIGIVVNNGIVLVDHINTLRRQGAERVDAVITGGGDRLRPVLMTAITTLFGLLPLAASSATVAGVYIDSLAVAVIGGLLTSTIFTLIAMPVWYTTVEDLGSLIYRALPRRSGPGRLPVPRQGVLSSGETER